MTGREFIEHNFGVRDGKVKTCSSIFKDGRGDIYSYGYHYPMLFEIDGFVFRNIAGYSHTTSKHLSWTYGIQAINVKLDRTEAAAISNSLNSSDLRLLTVIKAFEREVDALEVEIAKHKPGTKVYGFYADRLNYINASLEALKEGLMV